MNTTFIAASRLSKTLLLTLILLASATAMAASDKEWLYTVHPGDTLSQIAEKHLDRPSVWPALQKLNKLADPNRLRPGSILRIPYALSGKNASFAEVIWTRGEVLRASRPRPAPIAQGDQLRMGDTVQTGANSSVTLRFADQSRLLISANSRITLTQMIRNRKSSENEIRLTLKAGAAESIVTPGHSVDAHYEVNTQALNLAVRGTRFRVLVDSQTGMTRSMVSNGTVAAGAQGQIAVLNEGFGTRAAPGSPPMAPQRLLEAPGLEKPAALLDTLPMQFSWTPLAGAQQYRVELLDHKGETLLDESLVAAAHVSWASLQKGQYQLRVRGIDSLGLEGKASIHDFTLNGQPEPPMLRLPLNGGVINDTKVAFRWTRPPGAQHYRFMVSDTPDFSHMIAQVRRVPGNSGGVNLTLAPGRWYFWRVAAETPEAGFGPDSDIQSFEIQASASEANAAKTGVDDASEPVVLRWKEGNAGQKYQVQASLEPAFRAPLLDTVQSEPQVSFERKGKGPYYVRLRRIDPDGLATSFEATQQFSLDVLP